jgi:hypothetical protein
MSSCSLLVQHNAETLRPSGSSWLQCCRADLPDIQYSQRELTGAICLPFWQILVKDSPATIATRTCRRSSCCHSSVQARARLSRVVCQACASAVQGSATAGAALLKSACRLAVWTSAAVPMRSDKVKADSDRPLSRAWEAALRPYLERPEVHVAPQRGAQLLKLHAGASNPSARLPTKIAQVRSHC